MPVRARASAAFTSATERIEFSDRQSGHRETATVKPTIQTVPMIMTMMPTLRRG
jgi:hypothetical protein